MLKAPERRVRSADAREIDKDAAQCREIIPKSLRVSHTGCDIVGESILFVRGITAWCVVLLQQC
jgi:hypothetical protein